MGRGAKRTVIVGTKSGIAPLRDAEGNIIRVRAGKSVGRNQRSNRMGVWPSTTAERAEAKRVAQLRRKEEKEREKLRRSIQRENPGWLDLHERNAD